MKYIVLCTAVLVLCLCLGWAVTVLVFRKRKIKVLHRILLSLLFSILMMTLVSLGYLSFYYHANEQAFITSDKVTVTQIDGGFFYDGPGTQRALVFYPGAKVEASSYHNLMVRLSENGLDCFLARMPFNMAIMGSDRASSFLSRYNYESYTACGHSMGGLVISSYATEHDDVFDSLVLLASYPTSPISENLSLVSIYGTSDGCLNRSSYENSRIYWPSDSTEYVIEGANHAGFASYGPQKNDGVALMTSDEQIERTALLILSEVL